MKIFFKTDEFITNKRSELFGRTDFIANCGGLLGLFMGVSILSIVEIIYYFIVHLVCRSRKSGTKVEQKIVHKKNVERVVDREALYM